jgi:hypothetical protein
VHSVQEKGEEGEEGVCVDTHKRTGYEFYSHKPAVADQILTHFTPVPPFIFLLYLCHKIGIDAPVI